TAACGRLLQQPLFGGLEIRKRIDTYSSILSHQHSKLSHVKLFWPADKRDFYPMARENPQSLSQVESVRHLDIYVVSRSVDEKLIVLRALAMFGNCLNLLQRLPRHARASKPCGEITRHLFHLKLQAHRLIYHLVFCHHQ